MSGRRGRTIRTAVLVAALLFAIPVVASAAWSASSAGDGEARALAMGNPTAVGAAASGNSAVTVSWEPPAGGSVPPDSYAVARTAPSSATVCTTTELSCADTGLAASTTYTYSVTARRGTHWVSTGVTVAATTAAGGTPNFLVELVAAGPTTAGAAFDVRVTARTGTATDLSYAGAKTLDWDGPADAPSGESSPAYPNPVTFTDGVATVPVTLYAAESTSLVVSESGRSGSAAVTVIAAAASQLRYTSMENDDCSSGTAKIGGREFIAKVSRFDPHGNPAVGSGLTVTMSRNPAHGTLTPTASEVTIAAGASESGVSFGYTLPGGNVSTTLTASAPANPPSSAVCEVSKS